MIICGWFWQAAVRPGLGADKIAVVFRNLMRRLGFKKYYIQGGDWGSIITKNMATFFPEVIMYQKNPKQKSAISISPLKFQLDEQIGPDTQVQVMQSEIHENYHWTKVGIENIFCRRSSATIPTCPSQWLLYIRFTRYLAQSFHPWWSALTCRTGCTHWARFIWTFLKNQDTCTCSLRNLILLVRCNLDLQIYRAASLPCVGILLCCRLCWEFSVKVSWQVR